MRLDLLFRHLKSNGRPISAIEQAEAQMIGVASSGVSLQVLKQRLLATTLKSPEPRDVRLFSDLFDKVFEVNGPLTDDLDAKKPDPDGPRHGPIDLKLVKEKKPETGLQRRHAYWIFAVIVLVLLGIFALNRTPPVPDENFDPIVNPGGAQNEIPEVLNPDDGPTDQETNDTTPEPSFDPVQETVRISSLIVGAATLSGNLNLRRLADVFAPDLPVGMTKDQFLHTLMVKTATDPDLVFVLNQSAHRQLTLHVLRLLAPGQLADADVLEGAGIAFGLMAETPSNFAAASEITKSRNTDFNSAIQLNDRITSLATTILPDEKSLSFAVVLPMQDWINAQLTQTIGQPHAPIAPKPTMGLFPSWVAYVLALLLPLALLIWRLLTFRARMGAWFTRHPPPLGIEPKYWGGLTQAIDEVMGRDLRIRAARDLARPKLRETRRLDPLRTAIESARNGGRFAPVREVSRKTPSYLVIILRESEDDHQARQFKELVDSLGLLRTAIDLWYMDHDGNSLYQNYQDARIDLRDLALRFPERRIIVMGQGDVFLSPSDGRAEPWASDLKRWSFYALLTPRTLDHWGQREAELSRIFETRVFQATPEGLNDLARSSHQETTAEIKKYIPNQSYFWENHPSVLTSNSEPSAAIKEKLLADLNAALGPGGMFWLRASSVYPAFHWDLTIYLGKMLKDPVDQTTLINPDRFRLMAALPWFREGRFPMWAHLWLQSGLNAEQKSQVNGLLIGLLPMAKVQPDSAFNKEAFVTPGSARTTSGRHLDPHREHVFLELLAKNPPSGLKMEATKALAEKFSATERLYRRREYILIATLALYTLGAAWVMPMPASVMSVVAGAYLPVLVMALSAIVVFPILLRSLRASPSPQAETP